MKGRQSPRLSEKLPLWPKCLYLFLTAQPLSSMGSSAFFAFYPVLMQEVFGIAVWLSSLAFAVAVELRLLLYVSGCTGNIRRSWALQWRAWRLA